MSRLRVISLSLVVFLFPAPDLRGQAPDSLHPSPAVASPDTAAGGKSVPVSAPPPPIMRGLGSLPSPGSTFTALSDSDIVFSEYRSPVDLLRTAGGMFIIGSGEAGFDRLTSVNGLRPGTLASLRDGLLLNDPSSGLFAPGIYPIGLAERVEIAMPAMGPLYAADGVGGALNFVSRNMRAVRPVSWIRYTQAGYGYSSMDGSITQDVTRTMNVSLGVRRPVYDGRFLNSGLDAWEARAAVRVDLDGAAVYASDLFTRWERGLNGGVSPSTPDSLLYDRIRAVVSNESASEVLVRHDAAAGVVFGDPGDPRLRTTLDLQLASRTRRYIDEAGGTGSTGTPFRETRREQSVGVRFVHSRVVGGEGFTAGVEILNRRLLEDPNVGARRTTRSSAFLRGDIRALSPIRVSPSVRFDRSMDVSRLSAGADASARLSHLVSLRVSLSRTHRFPTFIEAFGIAGTLLPLPEAKPERHDVFSAGLTLGDSSTSFFSLGFFSRKVTDAVAVDSASGAGPGLLAFHAIPEESRSGASASVRFTAGSIVAELNADFLAYGGAFERRYAPKWFFGGGLFYRGKLVGDHLNLKAGFRGRAFTGYDGGQLSRRYETWLPADVTVPAAGTIDFVMIAGLGDAYIHFIWENLLDRKYFMEVLYPADDRSVRIGVTWSFLD